MARRWHDFKMLTSPSQGGTGENIVLRILPSHQHRLTRVGRGGRIRPSCPSYHSGQAHQVAHPHEKHLTPSAMRMPIGSPGLTTKGYPRMICSSAAERRPLGQRQMESAMDPGCNYLEREGLYPVLPCRYPFRHQGQARFSRHSR